MTAAAALASALVAGGCAGYRPPAELRAEECRTIAVPPDRAFAALKAYYSANGATGHMALDEDARLMTMSDPTSLKRGWYRYETVWVKPAAGASGGSDLRIKSIWGIGTPAEGRVAELAAEIEAIALGKKKAGETSGGAK
jgi:hypothetical protein